MNNNLNTIKKYINEHISDGAKNLQDYLNRLYKNTKIRNQLNNDEWENVIEFTYQQLLAHSMQDGVISDIEKQELLNIRNLKTEWGQTKDTIKFKLTASIASVEKSHNHDKFSPPKPTPWDNQWNKK